MLTFTKGELSFERCGEGFSTAVFACLPNGCKQVFSSDRTDSSFRARYYFPIIAVGAFDIPPQVIRVALRYLHPLSLYIDFAIALIIGVDGGEAHGIEHECMVENALVAQQTGAEN